MSRRSMNGLEMGPSLFGGPSPADVNVPGTLLSILPSGKITIPEAVFNAGSGYTGAPPLTGAQIYKNPPALPEAPDISQQPKKSEAQKVVMDDTKPQQAQAAPEKSFFEENKALVIGGSLGAAALLALLIFMTK